MSTPRVICPYCDQPAELVKGREVYPFREDLAQRRYWLCRRDKAWVGVHVGTDKPLGRLADKELRQAKERAHAVFDPLWKSGGMSRRAAYRWMRDALGIENREAHIGKFDIARCEALVAACRARRS